MIFCAGVGGPSVFFVFRRWAGGGRDLDDPLYPKVPFRQCKNVTAEGGGGGRDAGPPHPPSDKGGQGAAGAGGGWARGGRGEAWGLFSSPGGGFSPPKGGSLVTERQQSYSGTGKES